jgi:formylglycine-generating enzyme required for sulfatase activity
MKRPGNFRQLLCSVLAACLCTAVSVAAAAAKPGGGAGKKAVKGLPASVEAPAAEVAALKALEAKTWTVPGAGIKMARIPAGTFVMGSPATEARRRKDEVQRTVAIAKPFYMSVFEVTQKQFYDLMLPDFDFEGWTFFRGPIGRGAAFHYRPPGRSLTRGEPLLLQNPMECVSWPRALEFCDAINKREQAAGRLPRGYAYRLPTEAEWEYACRAGTKGMFNVAADLDALKQQGSKGPELAKFAFFDPNINPRGSKTSPVGKGRKPNAWGLYDMHGNVAEWCLDTYAPYPAGRRVADPVALGPGREKVVRGGAFSGGYEFMRSACRYSIPYDVDYYGFVGIRLALAPRIAIPAPGAKRDVGKGGR